MIPVQFPEANTVLGRQQPEYEPLPVFRFHDTQGRIVACFRLSEEEIREIVLTRTLWIQQLTFGRHLQPIALSTLRPSDLPEVTP